MVKYSYRALENKFLKESWIRYCDNDCGAMVYYDVDTRTVRNAQEDQKDSIHKDTCTALQGAFKKAASFNWFPSFTFEAEAYAFIEYAKNNLIVAQQLAKQAEQLKRVLDDRKLYNKAQKDEWDLEKRKKQWSKEESAAWTAHEYEMWEQWQKLVPQATEASHFRVREYGVQRKVDDEIGKE